MVGSVFRTRSSREIEQSKARGLLLLPKIFINGEADQSQLSWAMFYCLLLGTLSSSPFVLDSSEILSVFATPCLSVVTSFSWLSISCNYQNA